MNILIANSGLSFGLSQIKLDIAIYLAPAFNNFLYIDGENCHFMDNKTFEQVEIPKSITGEQYKLLKENLEVAISFMEDKPISMELPNNIECTIESTDAAIKNQTASSSYKPALLDCGIKINVPPFIESGEKVIVDTRTLEYVKRVN